MQTKKMLPFLACALISSHALALDVVFTYDTNDAFFTPEWRDALEQAASDYEKYITNDVKVNVSILSTAHPSSEYEGALAWGSGSSSTYPISFTSNWTGDITFNENFNWYYTTRNPDGFDLYTVALHELGHVFGVGVASTWDSKVSGGYFTGETAASIYGGLVPVSTDDGGAHWAAGTQGILPGTNTLQEASYTPFIGNGERKYLTNLDLAGLKDIGWAVPSVPEPEMLYMLLTGLGIVGLAARRRYVG